MCRCPPRRSTCILTRPGCALLSTGCPARAGWPGGRGDRAGSRGRRGAGRSGRPGRRDGGGSSSRVRRPGASRLRRNCRPPERASRVQEGQPGRGSRPGSRCWCRCRTGIAWGLRAEARRLAGLLDAGFLAGAGWDPVRLILEVPPGHRLLGWQQCRVAGCISRGDGPEQVCLGCPAPAGRSRPRSMTGY